MANFELIASPRSEVRKGAVRRLRRTGAVPAVLYGAGKDVALLKLQSHHVRKQLENEAFFSHILDVKVDGQSTQVVIKALQRDPASNNVIHMDLLRVSSTSELQMNVPLHFTNEETCPGKKMGGVVNHLMADLEIACLPKDLPEFIELDIGTMEIGDTLHLSDIVMPEGTRLTVDIEDPASDRPVVSVVHAVSLEEPVEEEEGVEGEEAPEDEAPDEPAVGPEES
ncbi:MAG: 50S ribosomal protein L25/general stress protein Ctc [Gammaproteobacteria bacterium]